MFVETGEWKPGPWHDHGRPWPSRPPSRAGSCKSYLLASFPGDSVDGRRADKRCDTARRGRSGSRGGAAGGGGCNVPGVAEEPTCVQGSWVSLVAWMVLVLSSLHRIRACVECGLSLFRPLQLAGGIDCAAAAYPPHLPVSFLVPVSKILFLPCTVLNLPRVTGRAIWPEAPAVAWVLQHARFQSFLSGFFSFGFLVAGFGTASTF